MFEDEEDDLSYLEAAADTVDDDDDVARAYLSFDVIVDGDEDEEEDEDSESYK